MIDTLILIELAYAMLVYILRSSYFSAFFHNYEKPTQSSETPAKTNIATAKNAKDYDMSNNKSIKHLEKYMNSQSLAEEMIPAVGNLYRQRNVIVTVFGGKSTKTRNAQVAKLMDLGFREAPSQARVTSVARLGLGSVSSGRSCCMCAE